MCMSPERLANIRARLPSRHLIDAILRQPALDDFWSPIIANTLKRHIQRRFDRVCHQH